MNNRSVKHWLTLFFCALLVGCSMGMNANCAGVFMPHIADELQVGRVFLGFCTTIGMLLTGVTGFIVNKLISAGKLKLCLFLGVFAGCGSVLLTSFAKSAPVYMAISILRSLGCGLIGFAATTIIINKWFKERNGLAVSLCMGFTGITAAIFSPLLSGIVESVGWRAGQRWLALFMFVPTFIAALLLKGEPAECGLLPYGDDGRAEEVIKTEKVKYLSAPVILLALFVLTASTGICFGAYTVDYGATKGLAPSVGALMVSALMIGNIVSNVLVGWTADRIGGVKASVLYMTVSLIPIPFMCLLKTDISMIYMVLLFLFGFDYGASGVLTSVLSRECFGRERYGSVYAVMGLCMNIGAAIASSLTGAAYDAYGHYHTALWGMGIGYAVSIAAVLILGKLVRKNRV